MAGGYIGNPILPSDNYGNATMTISLVGGLDGIAAALCVGAVVALAVSGSELPRKIRTFTGSSPEERNFDQRARRLVWSGLTSLSLAAAVAVVAYLVATH